MSVLEEWADQIAQELMSTGASSTDISKELQRAYKHGRRSAIEEVAERFDRPRGFPVQANAESLHDY